MVVLHCILYCTRVPHATSKSVLNTARSSHPQPRYAHLLALSCYVSGRLHFMNLYGAHTASLTGTHAREARAPCRALTCTHMHMFINILRTRICVCIYRLPRAHPLRCRLRRRPRYIRTCRCAYLIYALAYAYACNGSSRGPGSLGESRRLPTGVMATLKASPHGSHNAGRRTRSAAASAVGPGIHIHTSARAFTYSHWYLCVLYNGSSREPGRLTGVTTSPHGSLGNSQVVPSRESRHRAHPQRCRLRRRPGYTYTLMCL